MSSGNAISNLGVRMETETEGVTPFSGAELTWDNAGGSYSGAVVSVKKRGESEYVEKGRFRGSARIDGLAAGEAYDFRVEAVDSSGSVLGAALESVGNVAGGSGAAPLAPTGVSGFGRLGKVGWKWSDSASQKVLYHEIEVRDSLPSEDNDASVVLDRKKYYAGEAGLHKMVGNKSGGLKDSVVRYARVRAVDFRGSRSGWSDYVEARTDGVGSGDLVEGAVSGVKLGEGSAVEEKIKRGAVKESKLGEGSVGGDKIKRGAVGSVKIGKGAVGTQKIRTGAVEEDEIGDGAVTAEKISSGGVEEGKIGDGVVRDAQLGDGSVSSSKIGAGAVSGEKISDLSVSGRELGAAGVRSTELGEGSVGTVNMAAGGVQSKSIGGAAVAGVRIGSLSVMSGNIGDGEVETGSFSDLSVTGSRIGTGAVDTGKIKAGGVKTGNLASGAVTSSRLAAGAVVSGNLASGAALSASLCECAVVSANIAAGAVRGEHFSSEGIGLHKGLVRGSVSVGRVEGDVRNSVVLYGADLSAEVKAIGEGMEHEEVELACGWREWDVLVVSGMWGGGSSAVWGMGSTEVRASMVPQLPGDWDGVVRVGGVSRGISPCFGDGEGRFRVWAGPSDRFLRFSRPSGSTEEVVIVGVRGYRESGVVCAPVGVEASYDPSLRNMVRRVHLEWEEVEGAVSYQYRYREEGASLWEEWIGSAAEEVWIDVGAGGLSRKKVYEFEVRSVDARGILSGESVVARVTTNEAPVAEAGADQDVEAKSEVTLDASGSSDVEGDTLTYLWEQVSGTEVELENAQASRSMFTGPSSSETHELEFRVTVSDGYESSADEVVVNVAAAPLGSCDNPHVLKDPVRVKGLSILDLMRSGRVRGTASGKWEEVATFFTFEVPVGQSGEWEVSVDSTPDTVDFNIARHDGSISSVGSGGDESYTETLSAGGTYKFGVWRQGEDDPTESSTEGVTGISLTLVEPAPTARAGEDQEVKAGAGVTLDGSASSDPQGDVLTYLWERVSGTAVTLGGASAARASFTAPDTASSHDIVFRLTVTDPDGNSNTDEISVNVEARPPAPQDLMASYDVSGDRIELEWEEVEGAVSYQYRYRDGSKWGSWVNRSGTGGSEYVTGLTYGVGYEFEVRALAKRGSESASSNTASAVFNKKPLVNAGSDVEDVAPGANVTLGGTASDPEGASLTYGWTQTGGTDVTLTGSDTLAPSFTAPRTNSTHELEFRFSVSDEKNTVTDRVTVDVAANRRPVCGAGADKTGIRAGASVTLGGTGSDPDSDALSYSWTQTGGPTVTLGGSGTLTPSFTAPRRSTASTLTFELTVSDGLLSCKDTVNVGVLRVPPPPPPPPPPVDKKPSCPDIQNKSATVGTAFSFTAPAGTGGDAPLRYSATGTGKGIGFNSSTRVFSGTPTSAGTLNITYTVTDVDGDSCNETFNIAIAAAPTNTVPPPASVSAFHSGGSLTWGHTPPAGITYDAVQYQYRLKTKAWGGWNNVGKTNSVNVGNANMAQVRARGGIGTSVIFGGTGITYSDWTESAEINV